MHRKHQQTLAISTYFKNAVYLKNIVSTMNASHSEPSMMPWPHNTFSSPYPTWDDLSSHYLQRFGGIARLYGREALLHLAHSQLMVIGIGGVGSWTAEALARSGVGSLVLVDLDDICTTNTNRQIHTLSRTVGNSKTGEMRARLEQINPDIHVVEVADFIDLDNVKALIPSSLQGVVDAIDSATVKASIIAHCKRQKIPLITVGSSGGKRDPRLITSGDLARTTNDPLLAKTRNQLRRWHNFSRNTKRVFSVEAIYSAEQMVYPNQEGELCYSSREMDTSEGVKLDCSGGFGACTMLTGSFGFTAASRIIDKVLHKQAQRSKQNQPPPEVT